MGFDWEDLEETVSMLGNDYYEERKAWKDLSFGVPKKKKRHLDED